MRQLYIGLTMGHPVVEIPVGVMPVVEIPIGVMPVVEIPVGVMPVVVILWLKLL